jgi:hypothetical protein
MARSKRTPMRATRTKVHILTGGIKEDVAQAELRGGELIEGVNYQEVDGVYHGYISIPGYERTDGTGLASAVDIDVLTDHGLDETTALLIECDSDSPVDKSFARHPIVNTGIVPDTSTPLKFFHQSYSVKDGYMTVNPVDTSLDIGTLDYVIDFLLRPKKITGVQLILEKANSYKVELNNDKVVFSASSNGVTYDTVLTSVLTVTTNTTYHVEVSRSSGVFSLSINGKRDVPTVSLAAVFDNSSPLVIGGNYEGNIGEIRFTRNNVHHYDDFVPPTMPYSYKSFYEYHINDSAREAARAAIQPLPGEGSTLGCVVFNGTVYGIRNDEGGSAATLYEATPSGWEAKTNKINPNGRYKWSIGQYAYLTGRAKQKTLFWASGVDHPQYLDGDVVTDVIDGSFLPDDPDTGFYANSIIEFKNRLFVGYPDGSLVFSAAEDPLNFDPASGAGEFYMEDDIVDLVVGPGDVLFVFCRTSTYIIRSLADTDSGAGVVAQYKFHKETFSKQTGAYEGTSQNIMGTVLSMSDKGITSLEATDTFGDFTLGYLSKNIHRTLMKYKNFITTTVVHRVNNQYRMFFNNGLGLVFSFNNEKKVKGITKVQYRHPVMCISEGYDSSGNLMIAFGSTGGFVYLMDSGTSFDGEDIVTKLTTSYNSYQSPTAFKRFRKLSLELKADRDFVLFGRITFDYGEPGMPRASREDFISEGEGGIWGTDRWGAFTYGSAVTQNPTLYTSGYGKNMSISLASKDKYSNPHTVNAATVEYTVAGPVM